MARCPECGSGLPATPYRYCPSCEHDLGPTVDGAATCAGCGARLEHGADACPGCGRRIGIDGPSRWSGRLLLTRLSLVFVAALWGLSLLVEAAALWGLLVFPPLAFLGARQGVERSPVAWLIGLGVPGVVAVLVGGIALHDPEEGASLWPLSMLFVLVVVGLTAGACTVGTHWTGLRRSDRAR